MVMIYPFAGMTIGEGGSAKRRRRGSMVKPIKVGIGCFRLRFCAL